VGCRVRVVRRQRPVVRRRGSPLTARVLLVGDCARPGQWARASAQRTSQARVRLSSRPSLLSELVLNCRHHEVHEDDVVRHAVQLQAPVKLLRDAGRQLRPGFFGLRHLCRLVLRSPRPTRTTPTPATAAPVLRSLRGGDAAEQRLDCRAHFSLYQVADHRQQTLVSRHRLPFSGQIYECPITSKGSDAGEPASGACWRSGGGTPCFA
jgi:hypothetical protein